MTTIKPEMFKIALAVSLLGLLACGEVFFYHAYVAPQRAATAGLQRLTQALNTRTEAVPGATVTAAPVSGTVPELLARVQELAVISGVSVVSVEPLAGPETFKLVVESSYGNFVQFLGRFETLQIAVAGFEILPVPASDMLKISINFTHMAAPSPVHLSVLANLETKLQATALRDPFHPWIAPVVAAAAPSAENPGQSYLLTSISEIGATRFATINGRDYRVGDKLQGREIRSIGDDSVTLVEKVGPEERPLTLRFRDAGWDRT